MSAVFAFFNKKDGIAEEHLCQNKWSLTCTTKVHFRKQWTVRFQTISTDFWESQWFVRRHWKLRKRFRSQKSERRCALRRVLRSAQAAVRHRRKWLWVSHSNNFGGQKNQRVTEKQRELSPQNRKGTQSFEPNKGFSIQHKLLDRRTLSRSWRRRWKHNKLRKLEELRDCVHGIFRTLFGRLSQRTETPNQWYRRSVCSDHRGSGHPLRKRSRAQRLETWQHSAQRREKGRGIRC